MAYMCTNKHLAKGATYLKLQMFPIPLGSTELLVFPHCQDVVQRSLDERYIHDTTKLGTHAANRVHVPNYRLVRLGFHLRFQAHVQLLHSWFNPFLRWLNPYFQWWNRHNPRKGAQPFFCVSADEVVACWGCTYISAWFSSHQNDTLSHRYVSELAYQSDDSTKKRLYRYIHIQYTYTIYIYNIHNIYIYIHIF